MLKKFKLWTGFPTKWTLFYNKYTQSTIGLLLLVSVIQICHSLRNEFDIWKVHGIMNTSGLLQSKWSPLGFTLTLQARPEVFMIPWTFQNWIYCFIGVLNGKAEQPVWNRQPKGQTRVWFCTCGSGVVRCQSHHQCHFWRMNLMFEAYCTSKSVSLAAVTKFM